jgi:transposase-like protein
VTQDDLLYRFRLRVFAIATELGNVRAACRAMGIHPSTYYRWKRQLDHYGPEILREGCVNAFMQLAGTRGADRRAGHVDAPCPADPRRRRSARRVDLALQAPAPGGVGGRCNAGRRPGGPAPGGCGRRSTASPSTRRSQATIPAACWRRNALQVTSARRGAGLSPWRRSVARIAVAETRTPRCCSSPLMRW